MLILSVVLLSGCSVWTRLQGKVYKDRKHKFEALLPKDWMRYNMANYFIMTKDGFVLNQVSVDRFKFKYDLQHTKRQYAEDMNPEEIAEVEIDNFKLNPNVLNFTILENRPVVVSDRDAYRFDYTYETKSHLKIKGAMLGFIHGDWVYRIIFEAADQHYFAETQEAFRQFLDSFKLTS